MATMLNLTNPKESLRAGNSVLCSSNSKSTTTSRNDSAFEERKRVSVDYERGTHDVSTRLPGLRKADIPKRHGLQVQNDYFQKDWTISEVADRVSDLRRWDDVDELLNCWIGRFARKRTGRRRNSRK